MIRAKLRESNSSSAKTRSGAADHRGVATEASNMAAVNLMIRTCRSQLATTETFPTNSCETLHYQCKVWMHAFSVTVTTTDTVDRHSRHRQDERRRLEDVPNNNMWKNCNPVSIGDDPEEPPFIENTLNITHLGTECLT